MIWTSRFIDPSPIHQSLLWLYSNSDYRGFLRKEKNQTAEYIPLATKINLRDNKIK
jgi:hypothetical protein